MRPELVTHRTDSEVCEEPVERLFRPRDQLLRQVLDEEIAVGQKLLEALEVTAEVELAVSEQRLAQVEHEATLCVDVLDVAADGVVSEDVEDTIDERRRLPQRRNVPDEVDWI